MITLLGLVHPQRLLRAPDEATDTEPDPDWIVGRMEFEEDQDRA